MDITLTEEKTKELMTLEANCPFGRSVKVGSRECINCGFNSLVQMVNGVSLGRFVCKGNFESVRRHEKIIATINKLIN